jgi:hypothetical protein
MQYWEYCCLFENIISAPSYILIDGRYQNFDGDKYGFIHGIVSKETTLLGYRFPIVEKIDHNHDISCVRNDDEVIGYSLTIITRSLAKEEEFYSLNNIVEVLTELGDSGWEVTATDAHYYNKDDYSQYDIEKRHLLLNKLNLSIDDGFIDAIQLTRTQYLMKREKPVPDSTIKEMERMKRF